MSDKEMKHLEDDHDDILSESHDNDDQEIEEEADASLSEDNNSKMTGFIEKIKTKKAEIIFVIFILFSVVTALSILVYFLSPSDSRSTRQPTKASSMTSWSGSAAHNLNKNQGGAKKIEAASVTTEEAKTKIDQLLEQNHKIISLLSTEDGTRKEKSNANIEKNIEQMNKKIDALVSQVNSIEKNQNKFNALQVEKNKLISTAIPTTLKSWKIVGISAGKGFISHEGSLVPISKGVVVNGLGKVTSLSPDEVRVGKYIILGDQK